MLFRVLAAAAGLSLALSASASAQQPLDGKLTLDPGIHYGVLPNGMHYYVRKNAYPAKRAELRLASMRAPSLKTTTSAAWPT